MVRKARALKQSKGILAYPLKKVGHGISDEIKQNVTNFFESDEISRMCPGMKDFVPVRIDGEKVHKQKRLILCNLDEVYQAFKAKHPCKIGFSKFCELRPKWCITVGARGTYSVCVCTQHQNVKLMSACLGHKVTYHTLIQKLVCEETNKTCMLHRCNNCPGETGLLAFLETLMAPELEAEESIQFKQWVHTDRTSLKPDICIISGDFSKNYSFILQDAVQGFHWTNSMATLHPFVAYCMIQNKLEVISINVK